MNYDNQKSAMENCEVVYFLFQENEKSIIHQAEISPAGEMGSPGKDVMRIMDCLVRTKGYRTG